jgi:hypothetical protein
VQGFLILVGLIIVRGHRAPYGALLAATIGFVIAAASFIGLRFVGLLINLDIGRHTTSALQGVNIFFSSWAMILLFLGVVLAMHDRLKAWDAATDKPPAEHEIRKRQIFWGVHGFFMLLMFVLGTAQGGVFTSLIHDLETLRRIPTSEVTRRLDTGNNLNYAFNSFAIFTMFDVIALAIYLRTFSRQVKPDAKDQVRRFLTHWQCS